MRPDFSFFPQYIRLSLRIFVALLALAAHPSYAQTGEIVEAKQPVRLFLDGEQTRLGVGDTVSVGDTVLTGQTGEAQIVFPDETRIVVGPNSQMKIDRLLFRSDNTARRFAVSAARGTFRFLSGNSSNRAYSVRTPIATMGIRGTAFDFAVPERANTDLVVYEGLVRFCRRGSRCASVPQGCQTVRLDSRRFTQPETQEERQSILSALFPYSNEQDGLRPPFRTATSDCESDSPQSRLTQIELPSLGPAPSSDDDASGFSDNPAE